MLLSKPFENIQKTMKTFIVRRTLPRNCITKLRKVEV